MKGYPAVDVLRELLGLLLRAVELLKGCRRVSRLKVVLSARPAKPLLLRCDPGILLQGVQGAEESSQTRTLDNVPL